jgi:hypothetical protein
MIADDHAAAARRRLLLTIEKRARAIPPITNHDVVAIDVCTGGCIADRILPE